MEMKADGVLLEIKKPMLVYMAQVGYSKREIRDYRRQLDALERYMLETGESEYTPVVGARFLTHKSHSYEYCKHYWRWICRFVERLNVYIDDGTVLLKQVRMKWVCPPQFSRIFDNYLTYLKLIGYRESTVSFHRLNCIKALTELDAIGVADFSALSAESIYYVFEHSSDKHNLCGPLRGFLRYLFKEKITFNDFALLIPCVRRTKPVPSVYTKTETDALLASFDRMTANGKRNYAITLLALRLGIRAGDIANLKISDLDFKTKTISFEQGKTGVFQSLPLLPEIETAITAYLEKGRPKVEISNLFLSASPPIRHISGNAIGSMMQRQFAIAGMTAGSRKTGSHSLRMTLASELVADRVPYNVVRKILGHENPTATKHYVKFDIEALRNCALAPPPLKGEIQKLIRRESSAV